MSRKLSIDQIVKQTGTAQLSKGVEEVKGGAGATEYIILLVLIA